jgi:hypothetical protein
MEFSQFNYFRYYTYSACLLIDTFRPYIHIFNRAILKQVDDYMESSQPGLNFSSVNRAEIVSQLHEFKFQLKPRMKSQPWAEQSSLKTELFCFCEEFKVSFTVNDRLNATHQISAALK